MEEALVCRTNEKRYNYGKSSTNSESFPLL